MVDLSEWILVDEESLEQNFERESFLESGNSAIEPVSELPCQMDKRPSRDLTAKMMNDPCQQLEISELTAQYIKVDRTPAAALLVSNSVFRK